MFFSKTTTEPNQNPVFRLRSTHPVQAIPLPQKFCLWFSGNMNSV